MKILHLICFLAVIFCGYDCYLFAQKYPSGWLFAGILAIVGIAIVQDYIKGEIQEHLNQK